jgi:hypothetical protein
MKTTYFIARIFKRGRIQKSFEFDKFPSIVRIDRALNDEHSMRSECVVEIVLAQVCGSEMNLHRFESATVDGAITALTLIKNQERAIVK